jgi:hypothetical protein
MEVIQFPPAKGLLDFDGMGIKIDVEEQRKSWNLTFRSVQIAPGFCNLDHVKAEEMARNSLDEDGGWFIDETGSRWAESIDYLEEAVSMMKAAVARLEVSRDRASASRDQRMRAAEIPDEDQTPVELCENLPASASIDQLSAAETLAVCSELTRILVGVTIADLRTFSKVVFLLSAHGYERWKYAEITRELVEIIRLRGLSYNKPRWSPTLEIVWKLWEGEKGLVSPRTIREFLALAGPKAAKSMTDDALVDYMLIGAVAHKNGDDLDGPE